MADSKKYLRPIQFQYNSVPFESYSEAVAAIKKKNLLSGEPVEVYYKDNGQIKKFLAVGDEISHNPLILESVGEKNEEVIIDGNYIDLAKIKPVGATDGDSIKENVVGD